MSSIVPGISPSMMCADALNLGADAAALEKAGAQFFHYDVMDGDFVPNFMLGPDVIRAVRRVSAVPADIHLMVKNPERHLHLFDLRPGDVVSVHQESTAHLQRTLAAIREVASRLSCHVFDSTSESRAEVHLAGVFACNFVNALYGIGQEMMARAGAPFEALVPLIVETARKADDSGDPAAVQTGPARRHDTTTMQRHMALLDGNGRLKNIYELMSQEIWEKTSRRN